MLISTRGIVLRTIKFSETSIITKIYTESCGLQSYIVNGVRKSGYGNKSPLFQPFTLLDLVIYKRENKNLQRIKDFKIGYIYKSLPFDIVKSSMALFLIEILNVAIREEEKNEQLFHFMEESIIRLDEIEAAENNFHLHFLLHLTKHLGFFPGGYFSSASPVFDLKEGRFTRDIPDHIYYLSSPLSKIFGELLIGQSVLLNLSDRSALLEKIIEYYQFHVSGFGTIKSHKILHEVFSN